jgi:hypothetical protein
MIFIHVYLELLQKIRHIKKINKQYLKLDSINKVLK